MFALLAGYGSLVLREALEPDRDDAREQLLEELAKPGYRTTDPGWLEAIGRWLNDFFGQFTFELGGAEINWLAVGLVVLAVALVVVAILVFGRPRVSAAESATGKLFGEEDLRGVALLRHDAEQAAARGDFSLAVLERFRAVARALDERTVVLLAPGTTAGDFARRAGAAFPAEAAGFAAAARSFDRVRYARLSADAAEYAALRALDERIDVATAEGHESLAAIG